MRNNARRKCKAFSLRSKIWSPRVGNQIWACTLQNLAGGNRITTVTLLMQLRRSRCVRLQRLKVVR